MVFYLDLGAKCVILELMRDRVGDVIIATINAELCKVGQTFTIIQVDHFSAGLIVQVRSPKTYTGVFWFREDEYLNLTNLNLTKLEKLIYDIVD